MRGVVSILCLLIAGFAAGTAAASSTGASEFGVPSDNQTYLHEAMVDAQTEPSSLRLRFVQPSLSAGFDYSDVSDDLFALCQAQFRGEVAQNVAEMGQVIVSIANKEVPFGETNPDVVQVFEVFHLGDAGCEWGEVLE